MKMVTKEEMNEQQTRSGSQELRKEMERKGKKRKNNSKLIEFSNGQNAKKK